jgi:LysM repeat protein
LQAFGAQPCQGHPGSGETEHKDILMKPRHSIHVSLALAFLGTSPVWAQPSPPCGDTIQVSRSDTLSSIAARCDTTEAAILRANPAVEGSDDLRVGRELKLTASTNQPTTERLGSLAREAGSALSGMAQDLTSSVDGLLDKNPDLRQRLGGIGDRINSTNVDVSKAEVSLAPGSGTVSTMVTISAKGLPADTAVVIGGGAPRTAYEVLQQARTSADGTLQASVRIPDWSTGQERFVVTVAAEEAEWKVRSAPFQITGTKL